MKAPWRCQVERTLHPFINYRNWDIVKGVVHHGFITILCIVLGSEVEGLVLRFIEVLFFLGFDLYNFCTIETLAVESSGLGQF